MSRPDDHDALGRGGAELHFHLLPQVDDGPESLDESAELAAMAVADGTGIVVATPHFKQIDTAELDDRLAEVRARLRADGIALEVQASSELAFSDMPHVTAADLDRIALGPADARWLLLEAPLPGTDGTAEDYAQAADELRARGFGVLVGHPERSPALREDAGTIRRELAAGSVLQLNATSLLGRHGDEARDAALKLAREGMAAVVASDAHRPTRGPSLTAAEDALRAAGIDAATAHDMVRTAPRLVLEQGLAARDRRALGHPRAA
ncbi:MAG TPA: CpsB/CapC family capsule biosynthesis tyrosine phosphatase [Solirubrobacteraceae bacterium]|nr:CpsB/CapC family capsule biosynthesis tyrosine phosphatase [Solirubrobacteraceae bacterium]